MVLKFRDSTIRKLQCQQVEDKGSQVDLESMKQLESQLEELQEKLSVCALSILLLCFNVRTWLIINIAI